MSVPVRLTHYAAQVPPTAVSSGLPVPGSGSDGAPSQFGEVGTNSQVEKKMRKNKKKIIIIYPSIKISRTPSSSSSASHHPSIHRTNRSKNHHSTPNSLALVSKYAQNVGIRSHGPRRRRQPHSQGGAAETSIHPAPRSLAQPLTRTRKTRHKTWKRRRQQRATSTPRRLTSWPRRNWHRRHQANTNTCLLPTPSVRTTLYSGGADSERSRGRGGAGNFFIPAELAERGTTSLAQDEDPTDDSVAGPAGAGTAATAKPAPRQWLGRGGAGNFAGAHEDSGDAAPRIEEFELQERERAQALQDQVRRCVDAQLPRPGLAHLGGSSREE